MGNIGSLAMTILPLPNAKFFIFITPQASQLTFLNNQAVATAWHRSGHRKKKAWPDENYARENLQLHSIGIIRLHDDGTPILDQFGKR